MFAELQEAVLLIYSRSRDRPPERGLGPTAPGTEPFSAFTIP
jgi:hypothetical protein